MDRKHLWKLNSLSQNDHLIWELIADNRRDDIADLLKNDFPLCAYVLNEMHYHGWQDNDLKEAISIATVIDTDLKKWVAEYFDVGDIVDLLSSEPELATEEFPSDEDCIKYKLWEVLCRRQQWAVVAEFAPEFLEQKNCVESSKELLNVDFDKYASLVFERCHRSLFLQSEKGWKYLIDHDETKWISNLKNCGELFPVNDIINYCIEKGLIDMLYKAEYYDELLEHGKFDIFIKNNSSYSTFLEKYPDKVNWEVLWNNCDSKSSKAYLIEEAFKNVLVENCSEFLWKHTGIIGKLRLLSGD